MNKLPYYFLHLFFAFSMCCASEVNLKMIEAPAEIKNAVKNILIIQNSSALHRVIKLDHTKFDADGNLILKKNLVLDLTLDIIDSELRHIDLDIKHDYRVFEYFKASDGAFVFSYAMLSTMDSEFPELKYGVISKNADGWDLVALGVDKKYLNKVSLKSE